jgi:hypothetical protein
MKWATSADQSSGTTQKWSFPFAVIWTWFEYRYIDILSTQSRSPFERLAGKGHAVVSGEREYLEQSVLWRVALATCKDVPHLDEDTRRLIAPLAARGISATPAIWDDPDVDWTRFDLVVVRSCWDYVPRRDEFLEWAARVPSLANPATVLAWNTHKRYLQELAGRDIPIVPTKWLQPHDEWTPPERGDWVIKPAVSMASLDTGRYRLDDCDQRRFAVEHVRRLHAEGRAVMVQPYMRGIDNEGEISLVYLGGVFSHAVRKAAVLTGPDDGVDRRFLPQGGLRLRAHRPTAQELMTADQVLAAVPAAPHQLLYARVDLVSGPDGRPVLMELELTEPQLYFRDAPGAAERMAGAIQRQLLANSREALPPLVHQSGACEKREGGFLRNTTLRA